VGRVTEVRRMESGWSDYWSAPVIDVWDVRRDVTQNAKHSLTVNIFTPPNERIPYQAECRAKSAPNGKYLLLVF